MDKNIISCGEVLDISVVGKMYEELKVAIEDENAIELNASDLQRVDGAGIQLLVAFFSEAEEMHVDVDWKETSEQLLDAASILGVKSELHLN